MDPTYTAALNQGSGDPAAGLSILIMLAAVLVVAGAALLDYWTGRSNIVTRALDRWST